MAITKTIEIDVNSQGAVSGIDNVTNSVEQTDKATQSLRSQLRKAQADVAELSDKFGVTSKEAIEAAKRAGELKDAIGDAKALTDAFNPDAKFNALSGSLSGVASGFSAVEGSLALAGVQSENLQETMVRLQAAMALSQGLQGLGESIDSFKQLGAVAKNALAGIRTGIAATGIGVLLIALGAVVAYWDDIKEAVNGVSAEQTALNEKTQANLDAEQKKLETIGSQDNVLKLQGKSERDILKLKISQVDAVIQATEAQIKQNDITAKAQIEAAKRNKEILKGTLDFLSIPFQAVLKTIDSIGSAIGKDFGLSAGFSKLLDKSANLIFDPVAESKKAEETRQASLKSIEKLKNDRAGFQLAIQNIDQQAYDKHKALRDKEAEEEKKALADKLAREKQYRDDYLKLMQDANERDLQEAYDLKQEQLAILDAGIAEETAANQKAFELDKKLKEESIIAEQNLQTAKRNALDQGLNLLGEFAGKNKALALAILAVQKGLAIADIISNSAKGIAVSQANLATVPAVLPPGVPNPAYGFALASHLKNVAATKISAATNIATILAQTISSASKTLSGGGGGAAGGGAAGGGGGAPTPQFNVVGNTGVNQIAATLGQQQPVQAFVVANQVTTQQALDRNIVQNASIG